MIYSIFGDNSERIVLLSDKRIIMDKKVIMHKKSTFCIALFLGLVLCACSYRTISLEAFTHPYNLNQVPTYRSPNKFYSYLQADTEGGWIVEIQKQRPIHAL